MNSSFNPTDAERIESLKAAILGGLSLTLTYCAIGIPLIARINGHFWTLWT
ncbi:hypothetical protein [Coleofasciculus sp.]|uniref:hypothetical protein n=1 Tax=Coleofasciculus sp. TaxID=3100458 RepID=UPI00406341BE